MTITKSNLRVFFEVLLVIVVVALIWFQWHPQADPVSPPKDSLKATSTTEIKVVPKDSPEDDDVVVTRTYTANVDGQRVTIPFNPVTTPNGPKGVIKQELDFTPAVQRLASAEKKNWEVGGGVGVHQGDLYIPLEVQRNYAKDKAISVEIHLAPQVPPKVTGGEAKWKLMF